MADPLVLSGARLSLSQSDSLRLLQGKPVRTPRTLLLVSSDTCPGVEKLMPTWLQLIEATPTDLSVQVFVVSLVGTERAKQLAERLLARGLPFSLYQGVKLRRFAFETGINSTPYTIVLDQEERVRHVGIGTEIQDIPQAGESVRLCLVAGKC